MPNQMLFMLLGSLALYVRVSGQPPPPVASNCSISAQRDALTQFYNLAGGPHWTNSSTWTSNTAPCFYPNIFSSSPPYLVLPSHCCWYGVACCISTTCIPAITI